jgi:hypothetical protein
MATSGRHGELRGYSMLTFWGSLLGVPAESSFFFAPPRPHVPLPPSLPHPTPSPLPVPPPLPKSPSHLSPQLLSFPTPCPLLSLISPFPCFALFPLFSAPLPSTTTDCASFVCSSPLPPLPSTPPRPPAHLQSLPLFPLPPAPLWSPPPLQIAHLTSSARVLG